MRRCFEAEQDSNSGATHPVQPVTPLAASSSSEHGPVRLRPKFLPEAYHSALPGGQHHHAEALRGRVGLERRSQTPASLSTSPTLPARALGVCRALPPHVDDQTRRSWSPRTHHSWNGS